MASKNIVEIVIKATDKASKQVKGINSVIGKLGKVAGIAGAAAAAAFVAVGIGAFNLAKSAAPIEGITAAFDGLTKSIDGGSKKMLAALKKESLGMISNTKLMEKFNLASQLVSKDFAEKLPDAMGYLTKAAAATGQDMEFMMDSMVRGVGRLSPMILDNLGIQVDATQAYEDFADANGLVATELSKTQQQTALMNQVMEKLKTNTADMPEVAGTAAQSFAAFQVKMIDLKETIALKLLPAFESIVEGLTTALESEDVQAAIDTLLGWIVKIVGTETTGIIGVVSYLLGGDIQGAFVAVFGVDLVNKLINFQNRAAQILYGFKTLISYEIPRAFRIMQDAIKVALAETKLQLNMFATDAVNDLAKVTAVLGTISGQPYKPVKKPYIDLFNVRRRASGGPVSSGGSYLVGEQGPEILNMGNQSGNITPNNKLGGITVNLHLNSAISLANEEEAKRILVPFIESGLRTVMAR